MELRLDVRELEPPVPLERILEALEELSADDWLRVVHSREPYPLYSMLREMDFTWRTKWQSNICVILIWHVGSPPPDSIGKEL
ncbi:MAG: hypothetical protein B6D77_12740 [gamma proteobacterium symbiont of Ctena orbiculata]|nr:MAG: hypothetical protein B6D77_12740 [gamma proteobacterium symbiont of Ctena orbiculata]PVV22373.1 MAG: hypothetical protein B6D78_05330 [gamma proteobacterium symbiont of Ctena orbiculata]PVV25149.1 MAG: hypothetical protein B6D79_09790 [gamma proteobacterium symbiont of Ctena orbiculata]